MRVSSTTVSRYWRIGSPGACGSSHLRGSLKQFLSGQVSSSHDGVDGMSVVSWKLCVGRLRTTNCLIDIHIWLLCIHLISVTLYCVVWPPRVETGTSGLT